MKNNEIQEKLRSKLTAEVSKVDMNGNFKIQFSHPVYPLKLDSLKEKSPVAVSIIWMNEDVFESTEPVTAYSVKFVSFAEDSLKCKLNFDGPYRVSKGAKLDLLSVWFRDPSFFKRKSDNSPLSTKNAVIELPAQVETLSQQETIEDVQTGA